MYWVMRRDASMTGPGGYYTGMERSSGPYNDSFTAQREAQSLNAQLGPAARRQHINYAVLSDEQIEEARRNGITIY